MNRYCDYDAIVHYQPGAFASKYAEDLQDKLELTDPELLEPWQIQSFRDGKYDTFFTVAPITVYRLYGKYRRCNHNESPSGASLGGRFVSTEFAESCIDAKMRLALNPNWKNTKMFESKIIVPVVIKISVGIVAPVTLQTNTILPGGAPQILLPKDWPTTWIQGYRRVSARQLQVMPTFWSIQPEEVVTEKASLYSCVCPRCCYPYVRILAQDEQVEIIGSKGRSYTLQYCCLNPDCQFYW